MTFLELQDTVMDRLNLTSTDARTRVKRHLNLRLRRIQSSINLARTRRGSKTWTTTSGNAIVSGTSIAKVFNFRASGAGADMLEEVSYEVMRQLDPSDSIVGSPRFWAIKDHQNDSVAIRLHPIPNATETFFSDILAAGTDMSADGDVPTIPTDYHDALVLGACADELMRMEKARPLALVDEAAYEQRVSDLRYFLSKNSYEARHAIDQAQQDPLRRRLWPNNTL